MKKSSKEELENIIMKDKISNVDEKILFTIIPELKDCKRIWSKASTPHLWCMGTYTSSSKK